MEFYANSHNLLFSTDPVPSKCKTKTMAFIIKKTPLRNMILCGNPLPWVSKLKHLGITITNHLNGCQEDMTIKNAQYIAKNNQLGQEFYFAHTSTKMDLNSRQKRIIPRILQWKMPRELSITILMTASSALCKLTNSEQT